MKYCILASTLLLLSNCNKASVVITAAEASSTLADARGRYVAHMAIDGDAATSWVEGKKDDGIGESLVIKLTEPARIRSLAIRNGFGIAKYYQKNNRVKELLISIGESSRTVRLADQADAQQISLPANAKGSQISLTIKSVYPGSKWRDTAISEIRIGNASLAPKFAERISEHKKKQQRRSIYGVWQADKNDQIIVFFHIEQSGRCRSIWYGVQSGMPTEEECDLYAKAKYITYDGADYVLKGGKLIYDGDEASIPNAGPVTSYPEVFTRADLDGKDARAYIEEEGNRYIDG